MVSGCTAQCSSVAVLRLDRDKKRFESCAYAHTDYVMGLGPMAVMPLLCGRSGVRDIRRRPRDSSIVAIVTRDPLRRFMIRRMTAFVVASVQVKLRDSGARAGRKAGAWFTTETAGAAATTAPSEVLLAHAAHSTPASARRPGIHNQAHASRYACPSRLLSRKHVRRGRHGYKRQPSAGTYKGRADVRLGRATSCLHYTTNTLYKKPVFVIRYSQSGSDLGASTAAASPNVLLGSVQTSEDRARLFSHRTTQRQSSAGVTSAGKINALPERQCSSSGSFNCCFCFFSAVTSSPRTRASRPSRPRALCLQEAQ